MAQMKIIAKTQIQDGTLVNENIADSTIELGKLVDGDKVILSDGSVAMAANLDAGSNKIVNVANPEDDQDAMTKKYADDTYLAKSSNLSYLEDVSAARDNLDVYSKSEVDNKLVGALEYKGVIDLSDGDKKLSDVAASLEKGWFYKIKGDANLTNEDASKVEAMNNGDMIIVNQDVADTTDTAVDPNEVLDKVDNSESADLLRDSDVSNDSDLSVDGDKLGTRSAIKDYVDNAVSDATTEKIGEKLDVTDGSDTVSDTEHEPLDGTLRVYLNGIREFDWTIDGSTIKFGFNLQDNDFAKDTVYVDYKY